MFAKILVANRGEIACRVIRTARRLGIRTVAVYSDADCDALHVRLADEARRIGPPPARESYLDAAAILAAARETGAAAVHPGYGFLAESESFARACGDAGVIFIGPPPEAIAAMGDKSSAKALMEKAGVPVVPGYHGANQDPAFLAQEARRIGYPVLVKACAAGGGRGMRVVTSGKNFPDALEGAKREAKSAFGDDRVLIERYLERPRHIEVQVFGDAHGNLVHLFERDCSVQRRHQKVLEEAPAPGMTEERRRKMGEAALAAARAVKYTGAGTVEFIAGQDERFYFMEMNTRLQVEHPVTEMITGLDLVEWQFRVAAGEPLPLRQSALAIRGHAIEARICTEDPDKDFLPATGRLAHLRFPEETPMVRVDSGVEPGAQVTPYYDPMIAKLIVHGADRREALARLERALSEVEIAGPASNVAFLRRVVASRAFSGAELDTGLIERHRAVLFAAAGPVPDEAIAAAAWAELVVEQDAAREHARASGDPYSPWHRVDGWRLNQGSHHRFVFKSDDARHEAQIDFLEDGHRLRIADRSYAFSGERLADGTLLVRLDGRGSKARVVRDGGDWHVFAGGAHRRLTLEGELHGQEMEAAAASLAAPMPGKVIQVLVQTGAKVTKNAPLVILEAMKMEHTIVAPYDGEVKEIYFRAGEQVSEGAELLRLEGA